jgi:MFS family permease
VDERSAAIAGSARVDWFDKLSLPDGRSVLDGPQRQHLQATVALSLGMALFTIPFVLLAVPAGYLADRFSKTRVIRVCKIAEIIIMLLGFAAIIGH